MELLLNGRLKLEVFSFRLFSPLSSQFRINFCKNLWKFIVLILFFIQNAFHAISWLTLGPQKSFTTLFSPDIHRKKAQYSFYQKHLVIKYQTSGAGGTRSPPATPHRLQNSKWPPGGPKMSNVTF